MKLLFDQNLSYKLCNLLSDIFMDISHVKLVKLDNKPDEEVWQYAKANDCVIISKDTDFLERSIIEGFPPKVIWLNVGNSQTKVIETLIRENFLTIKNFIEDETNALLILR